METAIEIVKNILLPKLEKDSCFSDEKVNDAFWKKLALNLLSFEEDAKVLYAQIYSLELNNAEKIIDHLPDFYSKYIKELAEAYVLGQASDETEFLMQKQNATFLKEVSFLETLERVIKKLERKRIKEELPSSYERLSFELSDTDLTNIAKKKGREDLKAKMMQWGEEMKEELVPVLTYENIDTVYSRNGIEKEEIRFESQIKNKSKVISLSWIKYAAAAVVMIAAGIFYFKEVNKSDINGLMEQETIVNKDASDGIVIPKITAAESEQIVLAPVEMTSDILKVMESEAMGFTSVNEEKVTVTYKDSSKRMQQLEGVLTQLKSEKNGDLQKISQFESELNELKEERTKYIFDGKVLTLFRGKQNTNDAVVKTGEGLYYLKQGDVFYSLKKVKVSSDLEIVNDKGLIETLEKILFENE